VAFHLVNAADAFVSYAPVPQRASQARTSNPEVTRELRGPKDRRTDSRFARYCAACTAEKGKPRRGMSVRFKNSCRLLVVTLLQSAGLMR
jgi:hypothetical protein